VITPEKIDEWIHEAEERPSSASLIIRFIGNRLIDLAKWNDELQADNLALRSEKKVEEYEERIANLEYQTELLKRQFSGDTDLLVQTIPNTSLAKIGNKNVNLIIYHPHGQVLRIEIPDLDLASNKKTGSFSGDLTPFDLPLRIVAVRENEEMLFAFDSGRTVTMPVDAIPAISPDNMDWQNSYLQPPLGTEELAFIQPVGRMALHESCIQVSRKAFVKKIKESLFETYLHKSYIGTGIKSPPDKTCELVLSGKKENLVLVSQEGYLRCLSIDALPTTIEEVLHLGVNDHVIAAFTTTSRSPAGSILLFITQNGKVIQRNPDWLEVASSYKTKGQSVFSKERRESGVRMVGAAFATEEDWGISLRSDGKLSFSKIHDLLGSGTFLSGDQDITIMGFTTYRAGI